MEKIFEGRIAHRLARRRRDDTSGQVIGPEDIADFLASMREGGSTAATQDRYRFDLAAFYESLPPDKRVEKDTLGHWRQQLLEKGCAIRTVNSRLAAANSLLNYLGRRDLQLMGCLVPPEDHQPEITRQEYLRLLETAKAMGKERTYLLIKLFGTVDLPLQMLDQVTVEAVCRGKVELKTGTGVSTVIFPCFLQKELLHFARQGEIQAGPIFLGRGGEPLTRGTVTESIKRICQAAEVDKEKGSPRCLHRMRQSTLEEIRHNVDQLVAEQYIHCLETEQALIGW